MEAKAPSAIESLPRERLARAAMLVASVLVALVVSEVVLRLAGRPCPCYAVPGQPLTVCLSPTLLFAVKPHSRGDINALGFRDREIPREKSGTRILVLGDSFVMGDSVDVEDTLPRKLGRLMGDGYEVCNVGVQGYGPDQSYARFRQDGMRLHPDAAILVLFPGNDFADLDKNALVRLDSRGGLRFNHPNPVERALGRLRIGMLLRRAFTGRYLPEGEELRLWKLLFDDTLDIGMARDPDGPGARAKLALLRAVLRSFRGALLARGVPFGAMVIPSMDAMEEPASLSQRGVKKENRFALEDAAVAACAAEGVECASLVPVFTGRLGLFEPGNRHLGPDGNSLAAREAARLVRRLLGSGERPRSTGPLRLRSGQAGQTSPRPMETVAADELPRYRGRGVTGRYRATIVPAGEGTVRAEIFLEQSDSDVRGSVTLAVPGESKVAREYRVYVGSMTAEGELWLKGRGSGPKGKQDMAIRAELHGEQLSGTFSLAEVGGARLWTGTLEGSR